MAMSAVDIYRDILPKTNCGECGYKTCLAFASIVVADGLPLEKCPYIPKKTIKRYEKELSEQHAAGKWSRRDMKEDALARALENAASVRISDLPERIGGRLDQRGGETVLVLPYFQDEVIVGPKRITRSDGSELTRYEQVFLYIHLARGGSRLPVGNWKAFAEFPNTISKQKSMESAVERPLVQKFTGRPEAMAEACRKLGGVVESGHEASADVVARFDPLPRVPVMLMFWDAAPEDGFDAEVKLLFDETVLEHLDIEAVMFLSERIAQLLCEE